MIGIGPVLIVVGVIAIIGTYVTIIHRALQSSERKESVGELTANRKSDSPPRDAASQSKHRAAWATMN